MYILCVSVSTAGRVDSDSVPTSTVHIIAITIIVCWHANDSNCVDDIAIFTNDIRSHFKWRISTNTCSVHSMSNTHC